MIGLRQYLRRARQLPPHVVAYKALRLAARITRHQAVKLRDRFQPSYGPLVDAPFVFALSFDVTVVAEKERQALAFLAHQYLQHRFDILGSGFVPVTHGAEVAGIEGLRYAADGAAARRAAAPWVAVSFANRGRAHDCFRLIGDRSYRAIDWQRDMRSGFRWSEQTPWRELRIGRDAGADIKMPWELSRMQFLPQLAIAALLNRAGDRRFPDADRCQAAIRDIILDFIATNPPRFGAAWGCPMDVGIRAANWVLACALLKGGGFAFDRPFERQLMGGLNDAAHFIAGHLEWAETGRSNHYLSDLTGLLFAAAALPRSPRTATWINFAARALASETLIQFHADGGNFEGSTGYHRLSSELVVYGLGLAARLLAGEPGLFSVKDPQSVAQLRVPFPRTDGDFAAALRNASAWLASVLAFSQAMERPDGHIIQIGDSDSGRLFKLTPLLDMPGDQAPREAQLHGAEVVAALRAFLTPSPAPTHAGGEVMRALIADSRPTTSLAAARPSRSIAFPPTAIAAFRARIEALPPPARRIVQIQLPDAIRPPLRLEAFPDFGLYCLRAEAFLLTFRCASHDRKEAPSGHTHDDNLSITLFSGKALIEDPGSYLYTSFPDIRNLYRSAAAHEAPRAREFAAVRTTPYLFELDHLMKAELIGADDKAFAGILSGPAGRILRLVEIAADCVTLYDGVENGTLAGGRPMVFSSDGYGRKTARPASAL